MFEEHLVVSAIAGVVKDAKGRPTVLCEAAANDLAQTLADANGITYKVVPQLPPHLREDPRFAYESEFIPRRSRRAAAVDHFSIRGSA